MNFSWITHPNAGGARGWKTGTLAYASSHDRFRTQKPYCSESSRNYKVGTVVRFQSGQKPMALYQVHVTTSPRQSGSGLWMGLESNLTVFPLQTWTAGRLPRPVVNIRQLRFRVVHQCLTPKLNYLWNRSWLWDTTGYLFWFWILNSEVDL
jgi:hypothetical protein